MIIQNLNGLCQQAISQNNTNQLLAIQNLCLDNIKQAFQRSDNNKKDEFKKNLNNLMVFVGIAKLVRLCIHINLIIKSQKEQKMENQEYELLLIWIDQERLVQLYESLDNYVLQQARAYQAIVTLEQNQKQQQLASLIESTLARIEILEFEMALRNSKIKTVFTEIINDISNQSDDVYLTHDDDDILITQAEILAEIKRAFSEELENGTFSESMLATKMYEVFLALGKKKLAEMGIPLDSNSAASLHQFAQEQTEQYIKKINGHSKIGELRANIAERDDLKDQKISAQSLLNQLSLDEKAAKDNNNTFSIENVLDQSPLITPMITSLINDNGLQFGNLLNFDMALNSPMLAMLALSDGEKPIRDIFSLAGFDSPSGNVFADPFGEDPQKLQIVQAPGGPTIINLGEESIFQVDFNLTSFPDPFTSPPKNSSDDIFKRLRENANKYPSSKPEAVLQGLDNKEEVNKQPQQFNQPSVSPVFFKPNPANNNNTKLRKIDKQPEKEPEQDPGNTPPKKFRP